MRLCVDAVDTTDDKQRIFEFERLWPLVIANGHRRRNRRAPSVAIVRHWLLIAVWAAVKDAVNSSSTF